MNRLESFELSPLAVHNGRYTDKYMNKARLDALHWRMVCHDCGKLIFQYDPEDDRYIRCHNCGSRKRVPLNIVEFTPDWINEQRRRDGFAFMFGGSDG